jgi:hypothetical protein
MLYSCPRCMICGETAIVELDPQKVEKWRKGIHVQNVWPEMSADERELLISGTHSECWNKMFDEQETENGS